MSKAQIFNSLLFIYMTAILLKITQLPATGVVFLIGLYQKTLSPDHGWFKFLHPYGFCRHYPSCSEYGKQAIIRLGLVKGGWAGARRVVRCNPWAEPLIDKI